MGLFSHVGHVIASGNPLGGSTMGKYVDDITGMRTTANIINNWKHGSDNRNNYKSNLNMMNPATSYRHETAADASAPGEAAARDQAAAAAAQAQFIGNSLTSVDEAYGIGNTQNAKDNAGHLGDLYSGLVSSFRASGDKSLQDNFGKALTANRATMASSGLNGSGVDADQQTKNLGELVAGKQQVNQGGDNFLDQVKGTINDQRLGLKDQIRANGSVDLGDSTTFANQSTAINQAMGQIPSQTLGNIFTQVGTNYANGNIAGAYGYAGNGAFGQNLGLRVNPSGGGRAAGSIS